MSVEEVTNLSAYSSAYPSWIPNGESISNIAGMGIAKSDDHTYVWYNNNGAKYVSVGTTNLFNAYFNPITSSF